MPYRTGKMLEGRTEDQDKALAEKGTAAARETTGCPDENIVFYIEEMSQQQ
ncbi:2-hydroxymuconate tautomerase [Bacillus sp. S1-R2T1-FB]|uniref:2-hydroxymuconate tautomerase n=1 Tax=Bacillus sp. S1-R2T1-FB TaxID=1973493 RepID=UPI000B492E21|nr:2-hydroxymuconate tautomerase [Bacillus sp. S1-R2T1-FB]